MRYKYCKLRNNIVSLNESEQIFNAKYTICIYYFVRRIFVYQNNLKKGSVYKRHFLFYFRIKKYMKLK